jgi:hypothetical protein
MEANKITPKEIGREGVKLINLSGVGVVSSVMNLGVTQNVGNLLTH